MGKAIKPEAELDFSKLADLLGKTTRGPWRIDRGGLNGDTIYITAYEREGFNRKGGDGHICSVPTERLHVDSEKDHFGNHRGGSSRSWKTPIKKASDDAELIVAAINALPELLRRLGYDGAETAWLIEWPADDYGPIRYWAAGKPKPVIDASKATRFSRRDDADAAISGCVTERGCKAVEHMWMPAQGMSASGQDPQGLEAKPASPVPNGDAPEPQDHSPTIGE